MQTFYWLHLHRAESVLLFLFHPPVSLPLPLLPLLLLGRGVWHLSSCFCCVLNLHTFSSSSSSSSLWPCLEPFVLLFSTTFPLLSSFLKRDPWCSIDVFLFFSLANVSLVPRRSEGLWCLLATSWSSIKTPESTEANKDWSLRARHGQVSFLYCTRRGWLDLLPR